MGGGYQVGEVGGNRWEEWGVGRVGRIGSGRSGEWEECRVGGN